ncbi:hypothetical protein HDU67_003482, partial [Dinochytrium kinnereticum]
MDIGQDPNESSKEGEEGIFASMKRHREDDGILNEGENASLSTQKMDEGPQAKSKKTGSISIQNDDRLIKIPEDVEPKCLGHVLYTGAHFRDMKSDKPHDAKLFLLPFFNSSHLYSTIEVRIPAEHLTFADNIGVRNQAVWGTDVYTDDSDIVSVIIHSGFYRPFDSPFMGDPEEANVPDTAAVNDEDLKSNNVMTKPNELTESKVPAITTRDKSAQLPRESSKPTTSRILPSPPLYPFHAKGDSTNPRLPDHDLAVTLRVLPRLVRYTGSTRFGISSRGWGSSHDGESIRVEKIEALPRGSVARRGRKRGSLEWATLGLRGRREDSLSPSNGSVRQSEGVKYEDTDRRKSKKVKVVAKAPLSGLAKRPPHPLTEDSVTVVFSPFGGHACIKYRVSAMIDWPDHLREALNDFKVLEKNNGDSGISSDTLNQMVASFETALALKVTDMKSMEKLPYWRIRMRKE